MHPLVCGTRASTFPRHDCPGLAQADASPGRRAQGAPDAQRTRGSHTTRNATGTPEHRRSLRNGLRLIARSPRSPGLLASVVCRRSSANLISASGDQDHTPWPAASRCARQAQRKASIASRAPRFVTIGRSAPLAGREHAKLITIFRKTEEEYLRGSGLT